MQFFRNPRINFVAARRKALLISLILIVGGIVSMAAHKGLNMGIDFAGGSLVEVRFTKPAALQEVRRIISDAGFTGAEITHFGDEREVLVKVKRVGEAAETAEKIGKALADNMAGYEPEIRRVESVGPKIGGELRTAAFWAIIYSLAGIVVYISWRFQFRFAIAAIIALVHDVLITLGFFSVTNHEISIPVIAALLTIVGYSLNDTIVVFDRIRENLHGRRREGYPVLINISINETLSRTIITGVTTIFVLLSLVILGGPVMLDFAVALLVGIVVGTYSSIYIASPILIEWEAWYAKRRRKK